MSQNKYEALVEEIKSLHEHTKNSEHAKSQIAIGFNLALTELLNFINELEQKTGA